MGQCSSNQFEFLQKKCYIPANIGERKCCLSFCECFL